MRRSRLVGGEPLTPREIHLLQRVTAGLTIKQVAREMNITTKTAHNILFGIYRKLQVQTLTHAVVAALRQGLLELRPQDPPNSKE